MRSPRFTDFATVAVLGLPLVYVLPFTKSANDYGVYVAVGRRMMETMGLADTVVLAHTVAGEPYLNGTWLAALVFGIWDRLGGMELTVLLHGICVALAFWIPFAHARAGRGASSGRAALATLLCAPLLLGNLGLRPQTLILWIFPTLHWIGSRHAHARWAPLAVGALTALWANVHGAFSLVTPLMGAFFVEALVARDRKRIRDTWVLVVVGTVAALVTPYGLGTWTYVYDNLGISMYVGSAEFEAVSDLSWRRVRLFVMAGIAGWLMWGRPRPRWADVFVVVGLALPAFASQRMAIWWGMAAVPILAERLATGERWRDIGLVLSVPTRRLFFGIFAGLTVAALVRYPKATDEAYFDAPVVFDAADTIRAHSPGGTPLFGSAEWSALFAWKLGSDWPYFLDTRAWIYSESLWDEYTLVARAEPGWETSLEHRGVEIVAVDLPRFRRLTEALKAHPGWEALLESPDGAVYARTHR